MSLYSHVFFMGRTLRTRRRNQRQSGTSDQRSVTLGDDPILITLIQWLRTHGWRPDIDLRVASFGGIRGLRTGKRVGDNEILISIPEKLLITKTLALAQSEDLVRLSKRLTLDTQSWLSLFLVMEKRKGRDSFWYPYLQSLPESYTVPYFLPLELIEAMPKFVRVAILEQKRKVETIWSKLETMPITKSDFEWAYFTVNTRAVYLNQGPETDSNMALAPYLDLFNHSCQVEVEVGLDLDQRSQKCYQIRTKKAIQAKCQAFINYGPHDNLKLFVEYGFIPDARVEVNDNDGVAILEEELLSRSRGRPECRQLLQNQCYIHDLGVSWNTLACLHLLHHATADAEQVFQLDCDELVSANRQSLQKLLQAKLNEIESSLQIVSGLVMTRSSSTSSNYLFQLPKLYLEACLGTVQRSLQTIGNTTE